MSLQLDLLSYVPSPAEMQIAVAVESEIAYSKPQLSKVEIERNYRRQYWAAAANVYLKIMSSMVGNQQIPVAVRKEQTSRLHNLRQEALRKVAEYE